jgi:DNA polymerase-3 subunit gamma/tau
VTVEALRQAWPSVVEAIKAKGRVAGLMVGNASVASFDEGVLTLRFPRQGEVKGFQGSKYEDLLKQALTAMFGINVVVRATWGGDTPPAGRRPGPGPAAPSGPASGGQPPAPGQAPWGQPSPGQPSPGQPSPGPVAQGQPSAAPPEDPAARAAAPSPDGYPPRAGGAAPVAGPAAGQMVNGDGAGTNPFGGLVMSGGGDLPPLPPPPSPDDEDFDPDDEDDYSSSTTVHELTGMALVQRELGAEIIAEYED